MEAILASFIKNKMYLRIVAFSEYCMDHNLVSDCVICELDVFIERNNHTVATLQL